MSDVGHLLLDRLRLALEGEIRKLDPDVPTVLLAHLMADTAHYGAERFLAVGKGFTVPISLLARSCFDYVALGHVHRHQILCEQPPIVYPGSIERVDFSEEKEEKGYVLVELERHQTRLEFCPLAVRPFRTIAVNLAEAEDPQADLLQAIQQESIQDAVVRLIYHIRSEHIDRVDTAVLHQALSSAHTYTIHAELVSQLARPRLPALGVGSGIDPLQALKTYLDNRDDLKGIASEMLEVAQTLLTAEEPHWLDLAEARTDDRWSALGDLETGPEQNSQLRLL